MIMSSVAIFFKGVLKIGRRFIVFVETLYIMVVSYLKRVISTLSHLRKLRHWIRYAFSGIKSLICRSTPMADETFLYM